MFERRGLAHCAVRDRKTPSLWPGVVWVILVSLVTTLGVMTPIAPAIVAVFPPWWDAAAAFAAAAAAGEPVRIGRFPTIFLVRGDESLLATRLREGGALVLINAGSLRGCGRILEIGR